MKFKNDKIKYPTNYLGAGLHNKHINVVYCWIITSVDYVKDAVENVYEGTKNKRWKLPNHIKTPMMSSYVPELDSTPELEPDELQYSKSSLEY